MGLSIWHLLVVLVVVLVVFGAGRLPSVMGDLGRGIRQFKAGLNGETPEENLPVQKAEEKTALPPHAETSKNETPKHDA